MIEDVQIPSEGLVFRALPRIDYSDAFQRRLASVLPASAEGVARELFHSTPGWVGGLMRTRDWIVRGFGLKTTPVTTGKEFEVGALRPGQTVGLFRVYENTPRELVLGQDDRHLDFRLSVLVQQVEDVRVVTLSTVVQFNNWWGRAYFLPVKLFHKRIVRAMLGRLRG